MKEINIGLEKPLFIPKKINSYEDDAICCDRVKGKVYEWVYCKNMDCNYCVYHYNEMMEKQMEKDDK